MFKDELQKFKKDQRLTTCQLASFLGVPRRTVDAWLIGYRQPTEYVMNSIREKIGNG